MGHEARPTCPNDIVIPNWELGTPAAMDGLHHILAGLLNVETLQVAYVMPSSAAMQPENRKHHSNDAKCRELYRLGSVILFGGAKTIDFNYM